MQGGLESGAEPWQTAVQTGCREGPGQASAAQVGRTIYKVVRDAGGAGQQGRETE